MQDRSRAQQPSRIAGSGIVTAMPAPLSPEPVTSAQERELTAYVSNGLFGLRIVDVAEHGAERAVIEPGTQTQEQAA